MINKTKRCDSVSGLKHMGSTPTQALKNECGTRPIARAWLTVWGVAFLLNKRSANGLCTEIQNQVADKRRGV